MKGTALLIIDMLNDFLDRWDDGERAGLVERTNELVAIARERGIPIIWVRQEFKADLSDAFPEMRAKSIHAVIEGTPGCQLDARLDRRDADHMIVKKRYSPFFETSLEDLLRQQGVSRLIIAGINTHACVRMAVIDAYQRDLQVAIASDCVDSYDKAHGAMTLDYFDGKIASLETNLQLAERLARS